MPVARRTGHVDDAGDRGEIVGRGLRGRPVVRTWADRRPAIPFVFVAALDSDDDHRVEVLRKRVWTDTALIDLCRVVRHEIARLQEGQRAAVVFRDVSLARNRHAARPERGVEQQRPVCHGAARRYAADVESFAVQVPLCPHATHHRPYRAGERSVRLQHPRILRPAAAFRVVNAALSSCRCRCPAPSGSHRR